MKHLKKIFACMLLLAMVLSIAAPVTATAEGSKLSGEIAITPVDSDGVTLSYDASAFALKCTEVYGLLRVDESRTLTLTASFASGWTYNADYTNFFRDHSENVTVTNGANGAKVFTFNAEAGMFLTWDELLTVGVYATPASLPKLEITTEVPFSQIDRSEYVTASYTLTLGTKQFESGNYSGTGSIKGRGNTSWHQPKKPYSIKLDKKASLLDIPKTKKYAIIPSYSDPSMIRNYMTYKSNLLLDGIGYVPKCEFVEVYLNGSYNGIYILVERVALESSKIDIADATAEDITGGYLIEKDIDGKIDYDNDLWFNCPYWANQSKDYFVIKDPEPEDSALADQMRSYLAGYMQDVHTAVMDKTSSAYLQYVDVDSWIDFIIVQELAKNIDGNLKTSCYMYKQAQDDKLYMTAPWDFDLAYGNPATTWNNADYTHNDYYDCPDATSPSDFMAINSSCPWFDTLYDDHEEFRTALQDKYAEYRRTLVPAMLAIIDSQGAYLDSAAVADNNLWGWNFDNGVAALREWFTARIEWLDGQWLEVEPIDLDLALNIEGGNMHFTTGNYPFTGVISDGRIAGKSGNAGVDNSTSAFTITLDMQAGDTLSFDYRVSSESGYDFFTFKSGTTTVIRESGEKAWRNYVFTAANDGSYTFEWAFEKDYSVAGGSDCVWVDNIDFSGDNVIALLGDADCNGVVNFGDISAIYLYLIIGGAMPEQGILNADFDGNGIVNFGDVSLLYMYIMGLED